MKEIRVPTALDKQQTIEGCLQNLSQYSQLPFGMWYVGGFVRDKIMGIKSKDIDIAVEAESFDHLLSIVITRIQNENQDPHKLIYEIRPEFFTVRANVPSLGPADFVLCRKEGSYSDGRRPDSVSTGSLYDDLARRDFCMNAIAMVPETGEIIDPFGGQEDLAKNLIKCVGVAFDRFEEDALRMLRAIRFSITRKMQISQDIEILLLSCDYLASLLRDNVSYERKRDELFKCFRFSSLGTLQVLERFPLVRDVLFHDQSQLWLEPSLRAK